MSDRVPRWQQLIAAEMLEYFGGAAHDHREMRIDFPRDVVFVPYPRHGTGAWVRSVFVAAIPRRGENTLQLGDIVQQCSEPGARGGMFGTVHGTERGGAAIAWDTGSVEYLATGRPPPNVEPRALRVVIVFTTRVADPAEWTAVRHTTNGVSWILKSTLRYLVPGCQRPRGNARTAWRPSYAGNIDVAMNVRLPDDIDPCDIDLSCFDASSPRGALKT